MMLTGTILEPRPIASNQELKLNTVLCHLLTSWTAGNRGDSSGMTKSSQTAINYPPRKECEGNYAFGSVCLSVCPDA